MGRLVKLIGSGIGLAAEAIHARKSRSSSPSGAGPSRSPAETESRYVELPDDRANELIATGQAVPADGNAPPAYEEESDSSDSGIEGDEEEWELDEAAEEADPPAYEEPAKSKTREELVQYVMQGLASPEDAQRGQLPCPVIIPQRRPRTKARGFASPVLDVIFIGATIAGLVPSVWAMVASTVVQVAVGTAKELQSRKRSNNFLDEMNEKLFMPRGLYALVMSFKPDATRPISAEPVDISQTFVKYTESSDSKIKDTLKGIRISSGKTFGEYEMPEAAPLIYPALDAVVVDAESQNKFKKSGKFIADYMDRRSQAIYSRDNPNSSLSPPSERPQFKSRYSDPTYPASSGSLVALVTGGHINLTARREERRERREARREARRERRGRGREGAARLPRRQRRRGGPIKRIMQQDVLYLMIVNMPTDDEVAQARATLEAARNQ